MFDFAFSIIDIKYYTHNILNELFVWCIVTKWGPLENFRAVI